MLVFELKKLFDFRRFERMLKLTMRLFTRRLMRCPRRTEKSCPVALSLKLDRANKRI